MIFSEFWIILTLTTYILPWLAESHFGHAWYIDYVKHGEISEELVLEAGAVQNSKDKCRYSLEKTSEHRIVLLGGSSTWGYPRYPCHETTYPAILQQTYTDENRNIEVINLGVNGGSLKRRLLESYEKIVIPHMEPDLVIFNVANNSAFETKTLFKLTHFLFARVTGVDYNAGDEYTYEFRDRLQRIINLANESRVNLLFVEEPICRDYYSGKNIIAHFQKAQAEICAKNEVPNILLQDTFDRNRDQFLFYDFVHLTKWGNRMLATKIYDEIEKKGLLAPPG